MQRGVALGSLGESGSSFRAEAVIPETASMGAGAGAEGCQWALTQTRTLWGGGAPKRGHGAALEPLAELDDALGGVGAVTLIIAAAEMVTGQAAKERRSVNGR